MALLLSIFQIVQFSRSVVFNSVAPWTAAPQASLSITSSRSLLKFMSIEPVMPSNHLVFCRPRLLLPSVLPSIRVFSSESTFCIRWPKYWSFSFSVSPSNVQSGGSSGPSAAEVGGPKGGCETSQLEGEEHVGRPDPNLYHLYQLTLLDTARGSTSRTTLEMGLKRSQQLGPAEKCLMKHYY